MKKSLIIVTLLMLCTFFLTHLLSDVRSFQLQSHSSHSLSDLACGFVGIKEKPGNRGYWMDRFNRNAGAKLGSPYCASFVYFLLDSANIKYPMKKSGLARNLVSKKNTFTAYDVIFKRQEIKKDDILIWQKGQTIFGHAGIVSQDWAYTSGCTIEANTSGGASGSQSNGDGIYERKRRIDPYNYFRIKWITRL